MSLKHSTFKSFSFAFDGIKEAITKEPNFRIHVVLAIIAIVIGIILKLTPPELAVLVLTIGFVLILELVNTTLEAVVDLVSPETRPKAKIAKDVSAAAVLLSAILSVLVGAFLFLPKLL